jgi:alpha-mannosidase
LKSLTWIETGPLRQRLQVVRQLNQSVIQQDYILDIDSPVLKIETWIHWQESQVVLKVAFPLALDTDMATGEIPFGAIGRPTRPITDADRAKWEVPALRWVDLSTDEWGVSLLTDCKHGFDVTPSQLRLTLLKAPLWPDPGCDRTDHHFTYAIYPHPGTWQQAQTVQQAQALNIPLTPFFVDSPDANRKPNPAAAPIHKTITPAAGQSLLSLGPDTVILTAFKPAEDQPHEFILRCYDACGLAAVPTLDSPLPFSSQTQVNLLEQPIPPGPQRPYQISTYRLAL